MKYCLLKYYISSFLLFVWASFTLYASTYEIDKSHSDVTFRIKHLVISTVTGRFDMLSGTFELDEKTGSLISTSASIETQSINTNEPDRDKHLRSEDFFDVKKFPTMQFVSSAFSIRKGSKGEMPGNLTIHGVTLPVRWHVDHGGMVVDPWGNKKAAFTAKLKIRRKDYGLTWNKILEAGGLTVGEDVEIDVNIEGALIEKVDPKKAAVNP